MLIFIGNLLNPFFNWKYLRYLCLIFRQTTQCQALQVQGREGLAFMFGFNIDLLRKVTNAISEAGQIK